MNEFDRLVWVALGFPFSGKFTHEDAGQRRVGVGGVSRNDDYRICSGGVKTSEFEKRDLRYGDQFEVAPVEVGGSRSYLDVPCRIQFAR